MAHGQPQAYHGCRENDFNVTRGILDVETPCIRPNSLRRSFLTIRMPHIGCESYLRRTVWVIRRKSHNGVEESTFTVTGSKQRFPALRERHGGMVENHRTTAAGRNVLGTYYNVSGGPIIVTCHSKRFESSTRPAEKPSTGCFIKSKQRTRAVSFAVQRIKIRKNWHQGL